MVKHVVIGSDKGRMGAIPLIELMLINYQLEFKEQISVKLTLKYQAFKRIHIVLNTIDYSGKSGWVKIWQMHKLFGIKEFRDYFP